MNEFSLNTKSSIITNHSLLIGFTSNTNKGLYRKENEDRISIVLNILKPPSRSKESWPRILYFGLFDGRTKCCDYLAKNLHHFIFSNNCFPNDPIQAIYNGFYEIESYFLSDLSNISQSGSCAIIVIIMSNYII